ncbi:hypothetical protein K1719_008775 [Acacia pycnantha]|nr:hypothetical protein K1719_008775 [Acacia pycnantha]
MATIFSFSTSPYLVRCCSSSKRENRDQFKQQLNINITLNGTSRSPIIKVHSHSQTAEPGGISDDQNGPRQKIPTEKQLVDPHRQGRILEEDGVSYRQTVVIRSYEVGADKTATFDSILYLLQETALNHVWNSGLLSDGFGATHEMKKNDLIWVVSRMKVLVDCYPTWGEVIEIDTWVGASGKNGMRRDWLIRSQATGRIFARATSKWVTMNLETRSLSKLPDEVRNELSPWFIEKQAIMEDTHEKIAMLDKEAKYMISDLKPKRSDLDMNHHVNNVKYVKWILETIPDQILESHQLSEITLVYRRECGISDIVQSLCYLEEDEEILHDVEKRDYNSNQSHLATENINGGGSLGCLEQRPLRFTHLLQANGDEKDEEIVKGRTVWKRKLPSTQ